MSAASLFSVDFNNLTYDQGCVLVFGPIAVLGIVLYFVQAFYSRYMKDASLSGAIVRVSVAVLITAIVTRQIYVSFREEPVDGFWCGPKAPETGVGMGQGCWGDYCMGNPGWSCSQTCQFFNGQCSPHFMATDLERTFWQFGRCQSDFGGDWFAHDHPCFVADKGDSNHGRCLGFHKIPATAYCDGSYHTTQRLCRCLGDLKCPISKK